MRTASKVSFISIILIATGLIVMSAFDIINDTVVSLITIITAIVGAFGIWLELNKEQEINQASFILQILFFCFVNGRQRRKYRIFPGWHGPF